MLAAPERNSRGAEREESRQLSLARLDAALAPGGSEKGRGQAGLPGASCRQQGRVRVHYCPVCVSRKTPCLPGEEQRFSVLVSPAAGCLPHGPPSRGFAGDGDRAKWQSPGSRPLAGKFAWALKSFSLGKAPARHWPARGWPGPHAAPGEPGPGAARPQLTPCGGQSVSSGAAEDSHGGQPSPGG